MVSGSCVVGGFSHKDHKGQKEWGMGNGEWGMGNVANWESRHLGGCGRGAINPSICIMRLHTIDVFAQIGRGVRASDKIHHLQIWRS